MLSCMTVGQKWWYHCMVLSHTLIIHWGHIRYCRVLFAWFLKHQRLGTHSLALYDSSFSKNLNLCFTQERTSYTSGIALVSKKYVNDVRIYIFGWSIPLRQIFLWIWPQIISCKLFWILYTYLLDPLLAYSSNQMLYSCFLKSVLFSGERCFSTRYLWAI